jgi:hypothetical protein
MYRYYVETAVETDQKKSFPLFKLQFPLRGRRKAIYLAYHIRGEHVWYLMAYPILQQKSVQIELMTGLAWPGLAWHGWMELLRKIRQQAREHSRGTSL